MKHEGIISKLTLEEKCHLLSGRDFWQTQSVKRLGVENMMLSDGPMVSASRKERATNWD